VLLVAELLPLLGVGWSAAFCNWLVVVVTAGRWLLLDCISGSLMVLGARVVLAGSCQMGWCGWICCLVHIVTDADGSWISCRGCKLVGCFVGAFGGRLDGVPTRAS